MIPQAYITEWQNAVPWQSDAQIEQDLILNRVLVNIFKNEFLNDQLLFRGGTALHKLYFKQPLRYSEDLDFVQCRTGAIKPIVQTIQTTLDPWFGESRTQTRRDGFRLYYYFAPESDPDGKKRVKIEINTREHFTLFEGVLIQHRVVSQWYSDQATLKTYHIDELAATKLRALYQRKKGRDLFDLYKMLHGNLIQPKRVVHAFREYIAFQGLSVSKQTFMENLDRKLKDYVFLHDVDALLIPAEKYNPLAAGEAVMKLIDLLE